MKSTFFTLLLALVATTSASNLFAQPVDLQGGAIIEFTKEVHDYGTIKNGASGECTFEFTNKGAEPLILADVKGSCSCTVPQWPKEPIAPGAKGVITVKYNTNNAGPINKSITITSNAINEPVKVVRIKGNVLAPTDGTPVNETGAPTKQ
jgi:hypothetical protein